MLKTHVRPARDLRNNYPDVVRTLEEHDHVIITNNGRGESVLISMDVYAEFEKFVHEQYIYNELQKSKVSLYDPNVKLTPHSEVMAELELRREARSRV